MPYDTYIHYIMYKKWCFENNYKECNVRALKLFMNNNK